MTKPIHIMLDLETWGTKPGCDIRSIGACVFAPYTRDGKGLVHDGSLGTIIPFYQATDNPSEPEMTPGYMLWNAREQRAYKYALHRDPQTVQWWNDQSDEAQAAFADPVDLRNALNAFNNWICDIAQEPYIPSQGLTAVRLWSHGASFDPPILAAVYDAVGLPVPWHYRAPRDTRTLFDLAGIDDHSAWLNATPGPLGVPHHALDDAICQARAVCAAYDRAMRISHQDDRWSA